MVNEVEENYGNKERGYVQPYDDYVDQMISYIDQYATDEPSIEARRKMMKDAQVISVVEMIKAAVLSAGWELNYDWEVERDLGTQMVNYLYEAFNRVNEQPWSAGGLDDLMEKWMDALWFKKMVCELVFEHDKIQEYIYVKKAKVLPPESIRLPIDHYGNLLAIEQYPYNIEQQQLETGSYVKEGFDAVNLDMNKVLIWINRDNYGQFEGISDLDSVYKYWFLKDFILKFWSIFIERFGAPLLIAFVKAKNMKKAREGLKNIITDTSFTLEKDDKLEIVEPKKEGEVFNIMIRYCDNEITKGLLMPTTLMDSEGGGSKSLGDIHYRMFEYRVVTIQRKLQNIVRAFSKKEVDLNFRSVKHYPTFTFKPFSMSNRIKMAQTFDLLVKNALVHPLEPWIRKELQLPEIGEEFEDDLDQAWRAKMTAGSQAIITTPSPVAQITRTEAQTPQRQPAEAGETAELAEQPKRIKDQLEKADVKFRRFLVPTVQTSIEGLVKKVEQELKADKSIEFAEIPKWLKDLTFNIEGFVEGFHDMYDVLLVDVLLEDNSRLMSLGMKGAFEVKTRTGAFKWIDSKMDNIRSGLLDYGSANANALELRILEDTKTIVQKGLKDGLRGRDVVDNLRDTMLGSRYTAAQLEAVVRTNTTAIVNQGKKGFARANAPFVKGMEFVSIIDERTTQICEELNGRQFAIDDPNLDKYTPPLHFDCRSGLDYITEGSPAFDPEGITENVPEGFGDGIYALE